MRLSKPRAFPERPAVGVDALVADIHQYAVTTAAWHLTRNTTDSTNSISRSSELKVDVAYPFCWKLYGDYAEVCCLAMTLLRLYV